MAPCQTGCVSSDNCPVTIISAGAYAPPCGYSSTEPAPPKYALPAFNNSCILAPPVPRPTSRWIKYDDIVINKSVEQAFSTCKTFVIENNVHHQHNKTVITTVNRNHLHTQRIITKENNFHHFNTDYIVKVNDIHTQRIERLQGEGITTEDYRQTARVEPATCQVTVGCPAPALVALEAPQEQQLILAASPAPSQIVAATPAPAAIATPAPAAIASPALPAEYFILNESAAVAAVAASPAPSQIVAASPAPSQASAALVAASPAPSQAVALENQPLALAGVAPQNAAIYVQPSAAPSPSLLLSGVITDAVQGSGDLSEANRW